MKSGLNFRHVEAFYSVMKAGTTVEAARLLNLSQPAISRSIDLLELRVGYKLFERRGRRLVPRPEAELLYREIEPLYGSLDRIAQVAQDIGFLRAGVLRIATLPAMSQGLVPRVLARFQAARPKVSVFVQTLPSRQVADLVATRQFDVGVVELPLSGPAITTEPLEPVQAMMVLPAKHRLARKRQVSLQDLQGERLILLSRHGFLRFQIEDAFSRLNLVPHVVLETPSSFVACAMVAEGTGITIVSRWAAESVTHSQLAVRPVKEALLSRNALIFPVVGPRLALAEAFAQELREAAGTGAQ